MNDDIMKRFEERLAAKKEAQPKLHRFDAEFRISLLCVDEEAAQATVDIIGQHLEKFDDIETAKGVLK